MRTGHRAPTVNDIRLFDLAQDFQVRPRQQA
jgi:hypothetical protein